MKKTLCLVGCVLLMVCGLAPYGFGLRTEQTFTALVQIGAAAWDIPIYTTRYTRGWFCSTAETFLALPPAIIGLLRPYVPQPSVTLPTGLTLAHHIRHGPFPFATRPGSAASLLPVQTIITSSFAPGALGTSRNVGPEAALPALLVSTTVLLHGASHGTIMMPAFVYPPGAPTEAQLVWAGLHGDVTVTANGGHLAGTLRIPGLQFTRQDSAFALRDLVTHTEVSAAYRQPGHSNTTMQVGTLEVTSRSQVSSHSWAMTDAEVRAATTTSGATLQAVADVQLNTLRLADMAYGPGTSHLELRRFHLPTLATLLQEVLAQWRDGQDLAEFWLRLRWSGDLARRLAAFARTRPEMSLSQTRLRTPEGEIRASAQMRLDESRLHAPGYLPQLLQAIDAMAAGEAPAAWVRAVVTAQVSQAMRARYPMMAALPGPVLTRLAATMSDRYLHSLVEQDYIVLDGDTYRSKAHYSHGQLLVNGKPLHLYRLEP